MPRAGLEDLVAHEQLFELVAVVAHALHHRAGLVDPAPGEVVLQAADAVEVGVEAAAGDGLDQVEHVLAVAEGVEHGRDGAELHPHLADEQGDVGDAAELEEDRADVLRPRRRLDLHELLGGEDERHLVGERRQPVDAVDERRDLRVGADLGELLVAPVHVAADDVGPHDLLAVEANHDAERAVGGRVLRTDVEGHALGLELDVDPGVGGLGGDVRELLVLCDGHQLSSPAPSWAALMTASWRASSAGGRSSTSTMPGQGFTSRESRGKSLRRGKPSNSPGR